MLRRTEHQHPAADGDHRDRGGPAQRLPVDHVHLERLGRIARSQADRDKLRLFRSFDPAAVTAGDLGMDDPWYGTDPAYDQTYAEVSAAVPGIVEHVRAVLEERGRR